MNIFLIRSFLFIVLCSQMQNSALLHAQEPVMELNGGLSSIFDAWQKSVSDAEQYGCVVTSRGMTLGEPDKQTRVAYRRSSDGFIYEILDVKTNQVLNAYGVNSDYRFAISRHGSVFVIDELVTRLDDKNFAEKYIKRIDGLTYWGVTSLIRFPGVADLADLGKLCQGCEVKSINPVGSDLTGINFAIDASKVPENSLQNLLGGIIVVENTGNHLPREVHLALRVKQVEASRAEIETAVKAGRFIGPDGKTAGLDELPSIVDAFEKQAEETTLFVDGFWENEDVNGKRLPKTFRSPKGTKDRQTFYVECEQEITERLFEKPLDSSFRLPHYGLPEPPGFEAGRWNSWTVFWGLLIGIGFALVVAYLRTWTFKKN